MKTLEDMFSEIDEAEAIGFRIDLMYLGSLTYEDTNGKIVTVRKNPDGTFREEDIPKDDK